jgi:hypothetical protein
VIRMQAMRYRAARTAKVAREDSPVDGQVPIPSFTSRKTHDVPDVDW